MVGEVDEDGYNDAAADDDCHDMHLTHTPC